MTMTQDGLIGAMAGAMMRRGAWDGSDELQRAGWRRYADAALSAIERRPHLSRRTPDMPTVKEIVKILNRWSGAVQASVEIEGHQPVLAEQREQQG